MSYEDSSLFMKVHIDSSCTAFIRVTSIEHFRIQPDHVVVFDHKRRYTVTRAEFDKHKVALGFTVKPPATFIKAGYKDRGYLYQLLTDIRQFYVTKEHVIIYTKDERYHVTFEEFDKHKEFFNNVRCISINSRH